MNARACSGPSSSAPAIPLDPKRPAVKTTTGQAGGYALFADIRSSPQRCQSEGEARPPAPYLAALLFVFVIGLVALTSITCLRTMRYFNVGCNDEAPPWLDACATTVGPKLAVSIIGVEWCRCR
jgi:hypothetical protein